MITFLCLAILFVSDVCPIYGLWFNEYLQGTMRNKIATEQNYKHGLNTTN